MEVPRIEPTSSYRTLGVRISPSGSSTLAFTTLRQQSLEFAARVSSSNLNREAAYWAYWQYYTPKSGFPLPALTLTKKQCDYIQAPTVSAILSKLHMNQNTARAIVFGPIQYAGLGLPSLYTNESIGQLRLLLGHLRLQDKTAKLILIDLSYIQVLVGSSKRFLNLSYNIYNYCTESGWLISIWQLLSEINLKIAIRQAYVPSPLRENDIALMDYIVTLNVSNKILKRINRCRVHLQVIFLSDICSADGSFILPCYKQGRQDSYRRSTLDWPRQPSPPRQDWALWSRTLCHLETAGKLSKPLGSWVAMGHQKWSSFYDPSTSEVHIHEPNGWNVHTPIYRSSNYNTRSSIKPWYNKDTGQPSVLPDKPLYPASILLDPLYHDSLFQIAVSASIIPHNSPLTVPHHNREEVDLSVEPHPYYKELLCWDTTSMTLHIATLADAILKNDLHICADGAYRSTIGQGSHAWVFSTSNQDILWKGAGPAIGHPYLMTPYRAELAGLTSVLFVLHLISQQIPVDEGSITIYCDNAAALNEIFTGGSPSNNPYNQLSADKDLITTARDLLLQLPITVSITHQWVKGHYKGKRELKHELNNLADELAGEFNELDRPRRSAPALLPPHYEAELILDNYTVSSRLAKVIHSAMHDEQLRAHIMKRQDWSPIVFSKVDWEAHRMAYTSHKRTQRISISKLTHG